jgi:hypothetical protein
MQSAVATQVVPLPLDQAIEQWFLVVWIGGGGMGVPTVESNGNDNRVGHTRIVGGNVKEQITKFEHPTLIEYKIVSGLYPVKVLTGTVKFVDASFDNLVPETQIIWTSTFEPSTIGKWFPLTYFTRTVLETMLRTLLRSTQKK